MVKARSNKIGNLEKGIHKTQLNLKSGNCKGKYSTFCYTIFFNINNGVLFNLFKLIIKRINIFFSNLYIF